MSSKNSKISFSSQISSNLIKSPKISLDQKNLNLFQRSATGPVLYNNRSFRYSKRSNNSSRNGEKEKKYRDLVERKMRHREEINSRSLQQNHLEMQPKINSFFKKRSVKGNHNTEPEKIRPEDKNGNLRVFNRSDMMLKGRQKKFEMKPNSSLRDMVQFHSKSQSLLRTGDGMKKNLSSQKFLAIDNNIKHIDGKKNYQNLKIENLEGVQSPERSPTFFSRKKPVWVNKLDEKSLGFEISPKLQSEKQIGNFGKIQKHFISTNITQNSSRNQEQTSSKFEKAIKNNPSTPKIANLEIRLTDSEKKLWKNSNSNMSNELQILNSSLTHNKPRKREKREINTESLDSLVLPKRTGQGLNLIKGVEVESKTSMSQTQNYDSKDFNQFQTPINFSNLQNQKKLLNLRFFDLKKEDKNEVKSDKNISIKNQTSNPKKIVKNSKFNLKIDNLGKIEIHPPKLSPYPKKSFQDKILNAKFFHSERKQIGKDSKKDNFLTNKMETHKSFYPNLIPEKKIIRQMTPQIRKIKSPITKKKNLTLEEVLAKNSFMVKKNKDENKNLGQKEGKNEKHKHKPTHSASDLQEILKKYKGIRTKPARGINEYSYYRKLENPAHLKPKPVRISREKIFDRRNLIISKSNPKKRVYYKNFLTRGNLKKPVEKVNKTFQEFEKKNYQPVGSLRNYSDLHSNEKNGGEIRISKNGNQDKRKYESQNIFLNRVQPKKREEKKEENYGTEKLKNDNKNKINLPDLKNFEKKNETKKEDANYHFDSKEIKEKFKNQNDSKIKYKKDSIKKIAPPHLQRNLSPSPFIPNQVNRFSNIKKNGIIYHQQNNLLDHTKRSNSALNNHFYTRSPSPVILIPKPNYKKLNDRKLLKLIPNKLNIIKNPNLKNNFGNKFTNLLDNKEKGPVSPIRKIREPRQFQKLQKNNKLRDLSPNHETHQDKEKTETVSRSISPSYTIVIQKKTSQPSLSPAFSAMRGRAEVSLLSIPKATGTRTNVSQSPPPPHTKEKKIGEYNFPRRLQKSDKKIDLGMKRNLEESNRSRSLINMKGKVGEMEKKSRSPVAVNNIVQREMGKVGLRKPRFPMQRKFGGLRLKQVKGSLERKIPKQKTAERAKSNNLDVSNRVNRFMDLPSIHDIRRKKPGKSILKKTKSKRYIISNIEIY